MVTATSAVEGKVVAVSVALPQIQKIGDREVLTSIVREASAGPLRFSDSGLEGNRPAVHLEHVLAFTASHYRYWQERLGVPADSWPWAFWGENLTLTGLDENHLAVGDRVRIGAALLEITSPRTPCFKLSWRLGQPDSFLKELIRTGWCGIYLRVIEPADIHVGDPVVVERARRTTASVGDVARMISELEVEQLPAAREVLMLPELGTSARMLLGNKVNHFEDQLRCAPNRWKGWRSFRIEELREVASSVKSVRLVPVDGGPVAAFKAGQHLNLRLPGKITRSWSLSDFEATPTSYRLTVKRGSGPGSAWIHNQAATGEVVEVRAPVGSFTLDRANFKRIVLISGGVGVTPVLSMLKAHVDRGPRAPALVWLHSTINGSTHIHASEVDAALATNPLFARQVHYTQPDPGDDPARYDRTGFITRADLERILQTPFRASHHQNAVIHLPGIHSQFYVCGPPAFMAMVHEALLSLGVTEDNIFSETFGPASAGERRVARTETAIVTFARSGKTVVWDPAEDMTLLELAEEAGLELETSCRSGVCGTCDTRLLSGNVCYFPAPLDAPALGRCLPCCARPADAEIVLDV